MTQSARPAKLDLLHKGFYPLIAIIIAVVGLCLNNDKQKQIDRLQTEIGLLQSRQQSAEEQRKDQEQLAEEYAHRLRVQLLKVSFEGADPSESEKARDASPSVSIRLALLLAKLQREDGQLLGSDRAKSVWARARQQAETEYASNRPLSWYLAP